MESPRAKPPLWLLPAQDLPSLDRRRGTLGYCYAALLVITAALMFVFAMPTTRWQPEALLAVLLCLGPICLAAHADLRGSIGFECAHVLGLTTLVLLGPLAAVAVIAAGEATQMVSRDRHDRFVNTAVNVGIYAWAFIAATAMLELTLGTFSPSIDSAEAVLGIFAAGIALLAAQYATLLPSNVLLDGVSMRAVISRKYMRAWMVDVPLLTISILSVFLYEQVGLVGLTPLVATIVIPKLVVERVFSHRPIDQLSTAQAIRTYCEAIGGVLRINRHQRSVLLNAAGQMGNEPQLNHVDDFPEVMQTVLYANERWDGEAGGFPGVLSHNSIPLESRVLATAQAWAELTAKHTRQLSPAEALFDLRARAGSELDPEIVAAAVIAERDGMLPSHQTIEPTTPEAALSLR